MTNAFGIRATRVLLLLAAAILMAGAACEKPAVGQMGEPVVSGDVAFSVTGYDLLYLELDSAGKTVSYSEPVLSLKVKITNKGEAALTYSPTHQTQAMSEATTPLLYADPGAEATLPPATKETIGGVYLEKGRLPGQVSQTKVLQNGESLEDVFLFKVPHEKSAALILSMPPSMSHGNLPALIRVPYQYKEPKGPLVHKAGDVIQAGPASLKVDSAEVAYIETTHSIEGKGYSSTPWLKVTYTVSNPGDKPIKYTPEHDVEGGEGAAVYAGNVTKKRVKLSANASAVGRTTGSVTIEPGKSVTDFELFEIPDKENDSIIFEYPAARMGGSGLVRVSVPYTHSEPQLPKEMQKPDDKKEK
ncbi:hypothetical protein [Bradymonas sediminis]|nr:hypothetical protein [Bradymonas sediminis]TDP75371.1 hypothetical protein DFR33_104236 [Bradymonas sediminis]